MSKKSEKKEKAKEKGAKTTEIATSGTKILARSQKSHTIGSLEAALLRKFPREDALDWDVMGLTVGDASMPLKRVAVALDPTVPTIKRASELGCNVLVTHHPPFLEGPMSFAPEKSVALSAGAGVWHAISGDVALMNFHTALDVSRDAQAALPRLVGLRPTGKVVESIPGSKRKGFGAICSVPTQDGKAETLGHIAARCMSVFGRAPRVWGDMRTLVSTAACALGSASSLSNGVVESKVDLLICGEIKYHTALDLSLAGIAVIELGHDASELPLTAVLAKAISDAGVSSDTITIIDQGENWSHPESIRL